MIGNSVEIFGTNQAMKTLNEGVVEGEHDGCEPPGPLLIPEEHLTDIADVLDFGVTKTEFPGRSVSTSNQIIPLS